MKRRKFFQAVAAAGSVPALVGQQPPSERPSPQPLSQQPQQPPAGTPKLDTAIADAAAEPLPQFFTAQQFAALRKLSDILQPPVNGTPGAIEAKAPEFLDFLISESPADRKLLYRNGLDALVKAGFTEADSTKAASILASLRAPWTYDAPAEPLARFLRAAKQDVRAATLNSREYNTAGASAGGGSRRFGAQGLYWVSLDPL
jgi:hypothetical protein